MTRNQRRWHARYWQVIGPLIVAGLGVALVVRRPAPIQPIAQDAAISAAARPNKATTIEKHP